MYTELHAHSNFSFLDGASPTHSLVERAASCGMKALAITDHDGLYNACVFTKLAKEAGIKPIIGAELTFEGQRHLTFLVENEKGYANLSCLITRGHLAGSKGKPVLSRTELLGRTEGLICLSGCARSEISRLLIKKEKHTAYEAAKKYAELFGKDNFYIELQGHLLPEDRRLCHQLMDIAEVLGLKTVASNNVHYATRDGHTLHDVLTCIQHGVTLDQSALIRRSNSEYYLKDHKQMMELPWIPRDAILRTEEIARRCAFNLDFSSFSYPDFPLPDNETATGFLRKLAIQKARARYDTLTGEILARIDDEIGLIEHKGLSGYFLVVWDIIEYARRMGISAQGRGSAASSVVAYALGITPVDPIRHKLFVGRFLNETSIPDIDIDIATNRREEVIRYVYDTYGRDRAAMVCTYVTFQGRNAIREVGKVLGLPAHMLDRMAKTTSAYGGHGAIESLKEIPEFKSYLDSGAWEHFGRICARISDFPRHLSIHVGGMIITPRPISEIVPQEHARAEGRTVCQWDKDSVDDAGLIKFDLLGLRMLSLIDDAKELILKLKGVNLDLDRLPPDDPHVYDMISGADTVGIFQVESRAQMQTLPKMRPRSFEDLTIEVSIVRPGPLQGNMVHPFIRRRQGKEPVVHLHPKLAPILDETLGVILFQEQILQVAMAIAGFSAGEGNKLRKTMGRKNAREELLKWHEHFLEGARKQGIQRDIATKIFDHICGFADFGFCKSHAASFAVLCYRSAYLKYYYPAEFYCALLNNQPMGFYEPEVIIGDAKRHNIPILPVDINRSMWNCTIEEGSVRIGFRYVKRIGEEKGNRIITARARGMYASLQDFTDRSGLDNKSLQNLVAVGAFSAIKSSRRQLLWEAGTLRTAGLAGINSGEAQELPIPEMNTAQETITDYIFQGFSPSRHIIKLYRNKLDELGAVPSSRLIHCPSGARVLVAGYMVCLQMPPTAKGKFSFITLEDEDGLINLVVRPEVYKAYRTVIRLEQFLLVEGVVEKKDNLLNIKANKVESLTSSFR
ncbi:MAG: error-prone polymerase [Deltaproteobacteria bacterium]|nr:error-prone polymerase [Deltaproteobacteria bacterium]